MQTLTTTRTDRTPEAFPEARPSTAGPAGDPLAGEAEARDCPTGRCRSGRDPGRSGWASIGLLRAGCPSCMLVGLVLLLPEALVRGVMTVVRRLTPGGAAGAPVPVAAGRDGGRPPHAG